MCKFFDFRHFNNDWDTSWSGDSLLKDHHGPNNGIGRNNFLHFSDLIVASKHFWREKKNKI